MGRKTDVGVLSVYVTGDTTDFQEALARTAGETTAFKAVLQGSMNSIKGSFTEMMSKLNFLSQGIRGVIDATNIVGQSIQLAFDPTANNAAKLEETIYRLPFGFGEVGRSLQALLIQFGVFEEGEKKLSVNEQRIIDSLTKQMAIRKQIFKVQDDLYRLTADELDVIEMEADNAILPLYEDLRLLEEQIDKIQQQGGPFGKTGDAESRQALQQQAAEYRGLIKAQEELFGERKKEVENERERERIAQQIADAQREETRQQNELAKIEKARNNALKERQKLEKAIAAQQEKVRLAESQNWTGATATISTAIGSMKVCSESQTLAIQKRIMEETAKEVTILQDMRTIMQNQGAGALT